MAWFAVVETWKRLEVFLAVAVFVARLLTADLLLCLLFTGYLSKVVPLLMFSKVDEVNGAAIVS